MSANVLLPAWVRTTLLETVQQTFRLQQLEILAVRAGFDSALTDPDQALTIFAPSDDAFAALPEGTLGFLFSVEGLETLQKILSLHIAVGGPYPAAFLAPVQTLPTLAADSIQVVVGDLRVSVIGPANQASVIDPDAGLAINGLVHIIDTVLLLPSS